MNKELAVIGALLKDEDITSILQENAGQFFVSHADVIDFILDYYKKNRGFPPAELVEDKFVISIPVTVGSTKHHVEELRNKYIANKVREILRTAAVQMQDGEVSDAVTGLINEATGLRGISTTVRDMDMANIEDAIDHYRMVQERAASGYYGVRVGIPGIDDFLPAGIEPGMYGAIIGYPSRGKSWLSALMAVNAWGYGKKVLYVSLEMTESSVRSRMYAIAGQGKWSVRKLMRGEVNLLDLEAWATETFHGKTMLPVISNDGNGPLTPSGLRAKIEQYKPDIVFVDYLQLMSPDSGGDNQTIKMMRLSLEIKQLASSTKTPIIIVASATPNDASDISGIPELAQTAWSKQIAYDVDFALAVGRSDDSNLLGVALRKNRQGPLFDWAMVCDFDAGIFKYVESDFDN